MVFLWPNWRAALASGGYYLEGRMTGGGGCTTTDLNTGKDIQVSHGFELHCNASDEPNNLEVNWSVEGETGSHRFHLDVLAFADCSDQGFNEKPPTAGFDTYYGEGTGSYDGESGATAKWTFTDKGEPGKDDTLEIEIKDESGEVVLSISCTLGSRGGNHQAHPEHP
jgi:hypothetical protein